MIDENPIAFGEGNAKRKIKNIFNAKKPGFWVFVLSILFVVVIGIGLAGKDKSSVPFNDLSYRVKEILYEELMYSFTYTLDTAPQYSISSDYVLYSKQITDEDWIMQGELYPYEISRQKLSTLFKFPSDKVYKAIDQTKSIYRADIDDDLKTFYLVMQLKNGDVLLAVGYDHEDLRHIRWLFRLEKSS